MSRKTLDNPFNSFKATDFSDQEILDYWVDLRNKDAGLMDILQPGTKMPLVLLGGKGSGKTHLMRYYSTRVQSKANTNLRETILNEKFAAVYIDGEGLNPERFRKAGLDQEQWDSVFAMYFELWVSTNLLILIKDCYSENNEELPTSLITELSNVFSQFFEESQGDFANIISGLVNFRKRADLIINNAPLTRSLEGVVIPFTLGELLYGIPEILAQNIPELKDVIFAYLIDEAENFSESQQRFINTLIRKRRGNATIKVGARLYGIKTYETIGEEPIKKGAEFESVHLDEILRENDASYEFLAKDILVKRLQRTNDLNSAIDSSNVSDYFEELDSSNYWRDLSVSLLKPNQLTVGNRPYFKNLSSYIALTKFFTKKDIDIIISNLSQPDHPYLEKAGVFILYKEWPEKLTDLIALSKKIGVANAALAEGGKKSDYPFSHILDYYKIDILAQYHRDYQRRVPYGGLQTLINLSQGIPRNFLILLKLIHRRASFAGEEPFRSGQISLTTQSEGVRDAADWFWEDAQPGLNGNNVRRSVEALALLFRSIRYSDRPSECSLCSFSLRKEDLSTAGREVLQTAENWSYLIRVQSGHSNKNTEARDSKFQLSKMLVPKWDLTDSRRGNIELQIDMANAIFDSEKQENLPGLFKSRVQGMSISSKIKKMAQQPDLL